MKALLGGVTAVIICLGALFEVASAVDRNNFKTCDQSGFCRRNRRLQPGQSPFIALIASAEQKDVSHIELNVLNSHNQQAFLLRLEAIEGGSLRMTIDEKNSPVRRYIPVAALRPNIKTIPLTLRSKTENRLEAMFGTVGRVVVSAEPLRIDVYSGDTLVFSGNARGLMKFEHYRQREQNRSNQTDGPEANRLSDCQLNFSVDLQEFKLGAILLKAVLLASA
ncbi:neutral alpha-glucosidase AB-like [Tropilaelaps mercedesae]|uniref:Neutral alpha-glucosidase AB-like n=1 Tax=Tropilaelaps mercedesae TaxID=418985 RepID=A0A1V9XZQ5_9ACAR|nr:neutral alpha-glucosidase AB-like [Tropilaelaps mercedesae]